MESTSVGGTKYLKLIDSNNNQVKTWPAEIVAGFPVYWGWSPDGLFCAVVVPSLVGSYQTPTMEVFVYALSDYKKVDGTNVPAQTEIHYFSHTFKTISEGFSRFSCSWNDRSTALMVTYGYVQSSWLLVAPYVSDSPNNLPLKCYYGYGNIQGGFSPKEGPFTYLFSPNGEFAASYQLPYDKNIYGTMRFYRLRASTRGPYSPARNGITVDVLPNSGSPVTITSLKTGNAAIVLSGVRVPDPQNPNFSVPSVIDNPECLVGQAAEVYVRRNRISTIPNQTDYEKIGASKVAIPPGGAAWVEFPSLLWVNPTGAQNPGQLHYCIQAMGEAPPGDLAPGSLPNAPSWTGFTLSDRHFAQRNIAFV